MNIETITARVRKLLKLSENNNSPQEAAAAGAAAQRLIDQHNLSQAMLELETPTLAADEPIQDFGKLGANLDDVTGRWGSWLAMVVCKANAVQPYKSGSRLHLIGRASDVETVRYLYAYLVREVDQLARKYKGTGRTWLNNYRLGVVSAISDAFKAQKDAFEREAREHAATPGALVLVNQGLAKVETRMATVTAWQKAHVKLYARSSSRSTYDGNARAQGVRDGRSISINGSRGSLASGAKRLSA